MTINARSFFDHFTNFLVGSLTVTPQNGQSGIVSKLLQYVEVAGIFDFGHFLVFL